MLFSEKKTKDRDKKIPLLEKMQPSKEMTRCIVGGITGMLSLTLWFRSNLRNRYGKYTTNQYSTPFEKDSSSLCANILIPFDLALISFWAGYLATASVQHGVEKVSEARAKKGNHGVKKSNFFSSSKKEKAHPSLPKDEEKEWMNDRWQSAPLRV